MNNKDYYYTIEFRLYLHFPTTKSVNPFTPKTLTKEPTDVDPVKFLITTITERTLCVKNCFKVYDSECNESIKSYVENNIERFTKPEFWMPKKDEMIEKYLSWAKMEYGIVLDKKHIKYDEKFTWNIEFDEKKFEEECRINQTIDDEIEHMKKYHKSRDPYFW